MMEPIAMVNLTSELAYLFSLSIYPVTRATITRGRRSEIGVKDDNRSLYHTRKHTYYMCKRILAANTLIPSIVYL